MKYQYLILILFSFSLTNCSNNDTEVLDQVTYEVDPSISGRFQYNIGEYGGIANEFLAESNSITLSENQLIIRITIKGDIHFDIKLQGPEIVYNPVHSYSPFSEENDKNVFSGVILAYGFYANDIEDPFRLNKGEIIIRHYDLGKGIIEGTFNYEGAKMSVDPKEAQLPFKGEFSISGMKVIDQR